MNTETVFRHIQDDPELWAKWNEARFDEQRTALLVKVAYDLGRAVFEDAVRDEMIRMSLVSLPRKLEFMRERGMNDLNEVQAWMLGVHNRLKSLVKR